MNRHAGFLVPDDARSRARFTSAEFMRMVVAGVFDDMKVELIDGELERMPPPFSSHASRQALLIGLMWHIAGEHGLTLLGEVGIDLGDDTVVGCDLALLRQPVEEDRLLDPAEILLVVEVAETSIARDTTLKRLAYARGDPHYWVVENPGAGVMVYGNPHDGDYTNSDVVSFGQPLAVPGTDATIVID